MAKQPFDIDVAIPRLREAIRPYRPAALFELAETGFNSPFEQLVACIISIRTLDEVMFRIARQFFQRARTPAEVSQLTVEEIDRLISACTFHEPKAKQIQQIAQRIMAEHQGTLPCNRDILLSFHGVGPKCANLVLSIACGQPHIGVDVHVHRVTNRWGYVQTKTPEQTMAALATRLPQRYWIEINR